MKRLNKIASLLAVVTLVAALFGFAAPAAPVAADYGNMTWTAQTLPTATGMKLANGTDITAMAQSSDGSVMYVVDNASAPLWLLVNATTVGGHTGATYTVTYTDQDGTAGNVTTALAVPALTASGTRVGPLVLAAGDTGVRAVTAVTITVGAPIATDTLQVIANAGFSFANVTNGLPVGALPAAPTTVAFPVGAANRIYKSTDGGMSFTLTAIPAATLPAPVNLTRVAVAPDNASVLAVTDGINVYTSSDGATTWTALPTPTVAGQTITDLAVGPARAGTLLGREFVIAMADNLTATTVLGDVRIIGNTAAWATVGGAGLNAIAGNWDFLAVKVTSNFVGDRSIVAVGARSGVIAGFGTTTVMVINTSTNLLINQTQVAPAVIGAGAPLAGLAGTTIDFQTPAAAAFTMVKADIALPSDFDATTSSGRRGYVSFAAIAAAVDNDVYRFDDTTTRALGVSGGRINSVAFAGTVSAGTLFTGRMDVAEVKYSTDPTVSSPTWTATKKLLTPGAVAPMNTLVRVDSNFATSNKVFAGTIGAESALSLSTDAGVSFDGISLIDYGVAANVVGNSSTTLTSDGKTVFMTTKSLVGVGTPALLQFGNGNISLWKSPVPLTSSSWTRIYVAANVVAANASSSTLRLSPDWTTTSTMYFFDLTTNGNIFRSTDGGRVFSQRLAPTGIAITVNAISIVDSNTLYVADTSASPNLYKSTAGGFTWSTAVPINLGSSVRGFAIPKPDTILVSGVGQVMMSVDGGLTFPTSDATPTAGGKITGNAGENYRISASATFATDNTLFLADAGTGTGGVGNAPNAVSGNVYRYVIGKDTSLVNLGAPGTAPGGAKGFGLRKGALYVLRDTNNGTPAVVNTVSRTLNPYDVSGTIAWSTTAVPTPIVTAQGLTALTSSGPDNTLWASDGIYNTITVTQTGGTVWAYTDYLAVAKPEVTGPADKFQVSIDPVNGRADQVILSFKAMGTGTGLATAYDIQIWDAASVVPSANVATNGAVPIVVTNPNNPNITVGAGLAGAGTQAFTMRANTNYTYQVRAAAEASGATLTSLWSAPRTLNVQSGGAVTATQFGPQLLSPNPGATGVSLTPGFSWAPQFGATKYTFKLATDAALTKTVGGTPVDVTAPSFQPSAPLANDTTYFFSVNVKEPTVGPVAIGSFQTIAKAVVAPPPITIAAPPPQATFTLPPPVTIVLPAPAPPPAPITPGWIYAIIAIGAVLVIAVIVLIVRTRRVM